MKPENKTAVRDGKPLTRFITPAILGFLLIAGCIYGCGVWRFSRCHVSTDNATVTSDVVQIAPQVSGTVLKVTVKDNQEVRAGDLLIVLDDSVYKANVDQAQANLDAAVAQANGAGVSVSLASETGGAQVVQAQGIVSQSESSIAGADADAARADAAIATAKANVRSADAAVVSAEAALEAANANKEKARDAIRGAEAQLESMNATVQAAVAAEDAANAVYDKAFRDSARYARLLAQGAVSEQIADSATSAEKTAKAQLEGAKQQVAQAQSGVVGRQSEVNAARRQYDAATAAINEAKGQVAVMKSQASAARAEVNQAQAAKRAALETAQTARARKQQAVGQLTQAQTSPKQVALSKTAQDQARAKIEQAKAVLQSARISLGYTRIVAPVDGRVSKKTVEVGSLVAPGTPLLALVPKTDLWVVANFKETQLANVNPGESAEIEVDALPGRTLKGRVDSLSAGTGATFALLPPDNATGNYTKVVQRIPVKITLDTGQKGLDRLHTGMSVTATIATNR